MPELQFEWDETKAALRNLEKHGVTFDEASSVFRDPLAKVVPDPTDPSGEDRAIMMGRSDQGRLLLVVFTERADRIRIVSARGRRGANGMDMRKNPSRRPEPGPEGMLPEYDLDWSKAKPNPYAARLKDTVAVVLAPDVARAFPTSESVNTALRSVLAAVPRRSTPRKSPKSKRRSRAG